jgi:apolipoprotein N-acyltransferase
MKFLPNLSNILWTINSAILLVYAFPDYDFWYLAFLALIPFFYALENEKESKAKSFVLGWIWGIVFFFGNCWWISFPMFTYAGIPKIIAYTMALCVTLIAGLFPALFGLIQSVLLKNFGSFAILFVPFVWVFTEFLRYWLTGNNWNAIGYSFAFNPKMIHLAEYGGVLLISFFACLINAAYSSYFQAAIGKTSKKQIRIISIILLPFFFYLLSFSFILDFYNRLHKSDLIGSVIAIQPNVPMSGLTFEQWKRLRQRHVELAENALNGLKTQDSRLKTTIIVFPESPMNFEYAKDSETREFFKNFATKNNVKILFNSGEPVYPQYLHKEPWTLKPDELEKSLKLYNSAVLVNEKGEFEQQYDKINLLPFGEFIPLPKFLAQYVPPVVGNFTHGKEYDIFNFGEVKAGVLICFESHFPYISNEFAKNDADVLVEITNDGYLGNTPILRQHLANAVFRAVETNRPVLRVTNVGITAFINEAGNVIEPTQDYTEDTRIWAISKSDGEKTFYVKYGDWFAWLCSLVTLGLLFWSWSKR